MEVADEGASGLASHTGWSRERDALRARCAEGYTSDSCAECVFGYYRDKLAGTCEVCDDNQTAGMASLPGAPCGDGDLTTSRDIAALASSPPLGQSSRGAP